MDDMEKKQLEALCSAKTGALSDDELEGVSGGVLQRGGSMFAGGGAGGPQAGTFTGSFYMYYCNDCTWSAATDLTNEYDLTVLACDHMKKYPACPGVNFSRTLIRC